VVKDDKIIEDLYLIIESIKIDSIDLLNGLPKISCYVGENGQIYHTFNYITFNGVFKIKIHDNALYTQWLASML
jgi:hypothetical protein